MNAGMCRPRHMHLYWEQETILKDWFFLSIISFWGQMQIFRLYPTMLLPPSHLTSPMDMCWKVYKTARPGEVVKLVDCLSSIHEALGLISRIAKITFEHGSKAFRLWAPRRWRQENQKFKIILRYTVRLKTAWYCPPQKKTQNPVYFFLKSNYTE